MIESQNHEKYMYVPRSLMIVLWLYDGDPLNNVVVHRRVSLYMYIFHMWKQDHQEDHTLDYTELNHDKSAVL